MVWLIGVVQKHFSRVLMYGLIILGTGFFLYSAFLKPSNTTNIGSGGKVINNFGNDSERVPMFGCAAWRIQNETYWKGPMKIPSEVK